MATFDAGSIESRLTLDRSPFTEGLRLAKIEAAEFSDNPIEVRMDLNGEEQLTMLAVRLSELDGRNIDINVDTGGALAQLSVMQEMLDRMDGRNIDVNVDTAKAEAQLGLLDMMMKKLKDAPEGPGLMMSAIIMLAPIAVSALLPLAAILGGLASGMLLVFAGAGVLAAGIVPVVTGFKNLHKELDKASIKLAGMKPGTKAYQEQLDKVRLLQNRLKDQYGPLTAGMSAFQKAFGKFTDHARPEVVAVLGKGLQILASMMPALTRLWDAFSPILLKVLGAIDNWTKGPGFKKFIDFIAKDGPPAMAAFLKILAGLGGTAVHALEAFGPFADQIFAAFASVTSGWAQMSDGMETSGGFQKFMDYVQANGPMIWTTIQDVATAFVHIAQALLPLAPPLLSVIDSFAKIITNTPGPVLTVVGGAMIAIVGALKVWRIIQPFVTAAMWLFNAALDANPVGVVVIALAGLVAGLVLAWKKSEVFRDIVMGVWDEVKLGAYGMAWGMTQVFKAIVNIWDITVGSLVDAAAAAFGWVPGGLGDDLNKAKKDFHDFNHDVTSTMDVFGNKMKAGMNTTFRDLQVQSALTTIAMTKGLSERLPYYEALAQQYGLTLPEVLSRAKLTTEQRAEVLGHAAATKVESALDEKRQDLINAGKRAGQHVVDGANGTATEAGAAGKKVGTSLVTGVETGMNAQIAAVVAAARHVSKVVLHALSTAAGVASPSRHTMKTGGFIVDGLVMGIKSRHHMAVAAATALARATTDAINADGINQIQAMSMSRDGSRSGGAGSMAGMQPHRTIQVSLTAVNPVRETTSETATRQMVRLSELGLFEDRTMEPA